jgi:hypothetical protein
MVGDSFVQICRATGVGLATALLTAGCGGGAETTALPQAQLPTGGSTYQGPPPATADVQAFMIEVWNNLRAGGTASCGDCHSQSGGQAPQFARDDDVNLAYAEANSLADLMAPEQSRLVTKGAGNHNCWLGATAGPACADIMTTWIENWAGGNGGGGARQIQLTAPEIKAPGQTKNFPDFAQATDFDAVYNLVRTYCVDCHANSAAQPQSPFFADGNMALAYEAIKPKIDLNDPANSRLVLRLDPESHNCWSDCDANGVEMLNAIVDFTEEIALSSVDPDLVISAALNLLDDGVVASGGNRYEANQIALWEFKGSGGPGVAFDTSGVAPAMDLTLQGDVEFIGGWGINIGTDGRAFADPADSEKLYDLITATGEYAIEAWVAPANVVQEDTVIISYSAGLDQRNFMVGQTLYSYDAYNRSSATNAEGSPALSTADADEDLQATLQHVVVNYDPINGREIYVNGVFTDDMDPAPGGTLGDWDDSFALVLGDDFSNDQQWEGVIRLVAVHNRTLTPEQINQNLEVGVGEKFFLLFHISDVPGVDVDQAYIMFEVSQFDSYSYLFNQPVFLSLADGAGPTSIPLQGMRIGVNGREAVVGQAYANLDMTLTDPLGQPLSAVGTVVPLENGPATDEFFLSFELLGTASDAVVRTSPATPPPLVLAGPQPVIGLRTFDEINATMSAVTTIPLTTVESTFVQLRQQLPSVPNADTFSSAHEIAIAQLAIAYCDALLEDDTRRDAYFSGYDFNNSPSVALAQGVRGGVITPLLLNMQGQLLNTQPDFNAAYDEVDQLMGLLINSAPPPGGPGQNSPQRTLDISKAACATVLASGVVLIQ